MPGTKRTASGATPAKKTLSRTPTAKEAASRATNAEKAASCETRTTQSPCCSGAGSEFLAGDATRSPCCPGVPSESLVTDAVRELVALGAAFAANCEMCFKHHYNEARKLGVSKDDMRKAIEIAYQVKETPNMEMAELVERYLYSEQKATP